MSEEIDLAEFRRQKEVLTKEATVKVADKVKAMMQLVDEIRELVELTGIHVDLGSLSYDIRELNSDWNSSNC